MISNNKYIPKINILYNNAEKKAYEHLYKLSCLPYDIIDKDINLAKYTNRDDEPVTSITINICDLIDKNNKYSDNYNYCKVDNFEFKYSEMLMLPEVIEHLNNYYCKYGRVRIIKEINDKPNKIVIYF